MVSGRAFRFAFALVSACTAAASGAHDGRDVYTSAYLDLTAAGFSWRDEWGMFGEGHVSAAAGVLLAAPGGGCSLPLLPRDTLPPPPGTHWIALVPRGGCDFQVKVNNAALSEAAGIIVFDDRDSSTLEKMKLSPGNISAVFTYKWKGEELIRLLNKGTKIMANITIGNQCSKTYSNVNRVPFWNDLCKERQRTSVLFVSISFVILMVISLAWLVFYYIQRFRYLHAKDRLSRQLCSAAKKALSQIPTKNLRGEDKEMDGEGECCAICIDPFKLSETLRVLPCGHEFHRSCIDPWLLEHRTCPMCKMDILKHYGFVFTGSQESILDIDPVEVNSDTESLHQRTSNTFSHIAPSEIQVSSVSRYDGHSEADTASLANDSHIHDSINCDCGEDTSADPSSEELLSPTKQSRHSLEMSEEGS